MLPKKRPLTLITHSLSQIQTFPKNRCQQNPETPSLKLVALLIRWPGTLRWVTVSVIFTRLIFSTQKVHFRYNSPGYCRHKFIEISQENGPICSCTAGMQYWDNPSSCLSMYLIVEMCSPVSSLSRKEGSGLLGRHREKYPGAEIDWEMEINTKVYIWFYGFVM